MFFKIKNIIKEHKELRYLAYHDPLTGLLNRNWLYKNLNSIDKKYVYFVDINNLREYNKQGHTFGDKHILLIVYDILMLDTYKNNNIFVRYAGDEFLIFSNTKNLLKTNNLISVGFAIINDDIKLAINNADALMIIAKEKIKKHDI